MSGCPGSRVTSPPVALVPLGVASVQYSVVKVERSSGDKSSKGIEWGF